MGGFSWKDEDLHRQGCMGRGLATESTHQSPAGLPSEPVSTTTDGWMYGAATSARVMLVASGG